MQPSTPDPNRDIWFLGTLMHFHATADDTGGGCSIVEQLAPARFSPPLHVHDEDDAFLYVLSGQLTVRIGERECTLGPGQGALLPRRVPHTFRADQTTRLLEITTPGGSDRFYREVGAPAGMLELPPPGGVPDVERLAAVAQAHGTTLLGPPLAAD